MLYDAALERLAESHAEQAVSPNDAQLLATAIGRELGLNRGPLNSRCRIAIAGQAANAHNARVNHGAGEPARHDGEPVRTLPAYADNKRYERPLVTVNPSGRPTLRFPGLPPIRLLTTRPLPEDQPTYATVSVRERQVRVSLVYRVEQKPLPADGQWDPYAVLGLDLGVVDLIASSAGISHKGISQAKLQQRIKEAQRLKQAMVRKACRAGLAGFRAMVDENNRQILSAKGRPRRYLHWNKGRPTKEYVRAARCLSRLLRQRSAQRRAYRHQVAAQIVRHCETQGLQLVALERLNISGMTRSAKGTATNPGRRVRAKSSLNRRVLEQGWAELVRFIRYKARAKGIRTVLVSAGGTSQTCSECGYRDRRSRQGKRFKCVACPFQGDADQNAATNIGDRGTQAYTKAAGQTLEQVRRQRLAATNRTKPGVEATATGTDDVPGITRDAPRAEPALVRYQLSNSSQPALF